MVVGPVVAGAIYDVTKSYEAAFFMGGSVFILSGFIMAFIPFALKKHSKNESKAKAVRETKIEIVESPTKTPRNFTNGKPGALRKLAHQQSALLGKKTPKSKWNGEVHCHLKELNEIEDEFHGNNNQEKNLIV